MKDHGMTMQEVNQYEISATDLCCILVPCYGVHKRRQTVAMYYKSIYADAHRNKNCTATCLPLVCIQYSITESKTLVSHFGGVLVSVLTIGPKGHRFKPSQGDGFLRTIKICSTPSFAGEVKPEAPHCNFLWHVTEPCIV
jgi:hypothetical protein